MPKLLLSGTTKNYSINFVCGFLGLLGGVYIAESVHESYTKKQEALKCQKTEILINEKFSVNGASIIKQKTIPARIVPDSLLNNIQP